MVAGDDHTDPSDIRVSDAERAEAAERLRVHLTEGRLTIDEFSDRVAQVYAARTTGDLDRCFHQLPRPKRELETQPATEVVAARRKRIQRWRRDIAGFLTPNIACTGIYLTQNHHGYFWPGWVLFGTGMGFIGRVIAGETREEERRRRRDARRERLQTVAAGTLHEVRGIQAPRPSRSSDSLRRIVTAVLFVDIVGSTERAVALGDARWREVLDDHVRQVRAHLRECGGHEIFTKGDEVVATFRTPAAAVRCAGAIHDAAAALGLVVRAGIHAGEVDRRGNEVSGLALHIGQRVSVLAAPGETLVSSTVKELLAGSGIEFEDRGERELKGVPGTWRVYAVRDEARAAPSP